MATRLLRHAHVTIHGEAVRLVEKHNGTVGNVRCVLWSGRLILATAVGLVALDPVGAFAHDGTLWLFAQGSFQCLVGSLPPNTFSFLLLNKDGRPVDKLVRAPTLREVVEHADDDVPQIAAEKVVKHVNKDLF
jgi:hypothetical protein